MKQTRKAIMALVGSLCILGSLWWGHQQVRSELPASVSSTVEEGRLVTVSGTVTRAFRNKEGMWIVDVSPPGGTVLIMPSVGVLSFTPRVGDQLQIVARRVEGDKGLTFYPVSRDHVQRTGRVNRSVISLAQARGLQKGSTVRLRVDGIQAEVMTSNAGKRHLQVSVRDATGEASGILWEGSYGDREISLIRSGRPLVIDAVIDFFRGNWSLVILSVEEA